MQVLALDLSLTATGVALPGGEPRTLRTSDRGVDRLRFFREAVRYLTVSHGVDLVVIEDYAFHKGDAHAHALGELGGVVRLAIADLGVDFVDVKPSSLKKYATGKGNASKNDVLVAATRRLHYDGSSNDEADALWLQQMAWSHYYGDDAGLCVPMPAVNREALVKVPWPDLAPREVVA